MSSFPLLNIKEYQEITILQKKILKNIDSMLSFINISLSWLYQLRHTLRICFDFESFKKTVFLCIRCIRHNIDKVKWFISPDKSVISQLAPKGP